MSFVNRFSDSGKTPWSNQLNRAFITRPSLTLRVLSSPPPLLRLKQGWCLLSELSRRESESQKMGLVGETIDSIKSIQIRQHLTQAISLG